MWGMRSSRSLTARISAWCVNTAGTASGKVYHDEPQVLHFGQRGEGLRLEAGMVFTIEPMLNAGRRDTRQLPDGWTVVTKDRSLSAQWEHMVAVTTEGCEVLTPHGALLSANPPWQ